MRKWISLFEGHLVGASVKLTDLYTSAELSDESERLAHVAPPIIWDEPLAIHEMTAEEAKSVVTAAGTTVWDAYQAEATKAQERIVRNKIKSYDFDRIIVLDDGEIIDGNHHLIAAIISENPVHYVDISKIDD